MTAVFVANDQMALGLIRVFHEEGLKVPRDVSIVGFDDQPEAGHFLPPLTTFKQDFAAIGRRCVSALIEKVRGGEAEPFSPIEPELIVRASSADASLNDNVQAHAEILEFVRQGEARKAAAAMHTSSGQNVTSELFSAYKSNELPLRLSIANRKGRTT